MHRAVQELREWYRDPSKRVNPLNGWMGPITLLRGLKSFMGDFCPEVDLSLSKQNLEWACGPNVLRFYEERRLDCSRSLRGSWSPECGGRRALSGFDGLKFGLFEPGSRTAFIGWPRFDRCKGYGCNAGGWDSTKDDHFILFQEDAKVIQHQLQ